MILSLYGDIARACAYVIWFVYA